MFQICHISVIEVLHQGDKNVTVSVRVVWHWQQCYIYCKSFVSFKKFVRSGVLVISRPRQTQGLLYRVADPSCHPQFSLCARIQKKTES